MQKKHVIPPMPMRDLGDVTSDNVFVRRFAGISKKLAVKGVGNFPALRGHYEEWRDYIRDAVAQDAQPCKELIFANAQLAAWETHLGIGEVQSFPVSVSLNFTDICNARCSFCAYLPERVAGTKLTLDKLEQSDWLKFTRAFRPNGGGLGEPFAHPQAHALFETLSRKAPFMAVGAVTNGSYLSEDSADLIARYFANIYVSLNAAMPDTYEKTMSPLKWDATFAKLQRLRDKARAHGNRLYMRAGYVVHTENLYEMEHLPALLTELGFDDLNVNPMVPPPSYGRDNLYTRQQSIYTVPEEADAVFRDLEAGCAKAGITLSKKLPSLQELRGDKEKKQNTSGRSYEWAMFARDDAEPICWAPWRALKIDNFDKTLVCCNFFRKLPSFTWPTAKTFHAPDHMWNHPYMVHLRATMGTKDEVPFCTLCKQGDKRHLSFAQAKDVASRQSKETYARIQRAHEGRVVHGEIDQIDGAIEDWRMPGNDLPVFKRHQGDYRDTIARFGFAGHRDVLYACSGWDHAGFMLFLGEENDNLTVLAPKAEVTLMRAAVDALGFDNITVQADGSGVAQHGFDAFWMDGPVFDGLGRRDALGFARDCLVPGGRLRVRQARGLGQNVLDVLERRNNSATALAALDGGIKYEGEDSYLTQDGAMIALKLHGLVMDKTRPPNAAAAMPGTTQRAFDGAQAYAQALREGQTERDTLLSGLDLSVSFNCTTRAQPAHTTAIPTLKTDAAALI